MVVLAVAAVAVVVFLNRRGLVERYWTWQVESEDEEERWAAAEKLQAMRSPRAEDWYIARLTEEPTWERREQAARTLGEMKSVRVVRALLERSLFGSSMLRMAMAGYNGNDLPRLLEVVSLRIGEKRPPFKVMTTNFLEESMVSGMCHTREVLRQIGPAALDELARIRDDEQADEALRLHAELE